MATRGGGVVVPRSLGTKRLSPAWRPRKPRSRTRSCQMDLALRPRERPSAISSRKGSQALALGARPAAGGQGEGSGSVDTCPEITGFGCPESVDTPSVVAGFDAGSVDTPLVVAGFGGQIPGRPPLPRTAIPAALR